MSIFITFLEMLFLLLTGPFLISSLLMFMAALAWIAAPKPITRFSLTSKWVQLFIACIGTLSVAATQALFFAGGMNGSSLKSLLLERPGYPITAVLAALLMLALSFYPDTVETRREQISFREALSRHFPKASFAFIPAGTPLWRVFLIRLLWLKPPGLPIPISAIDNARKMSLLAGLSVLIPACAYPVSVLVSASLGG